jgi:putative spermidine/putrescine transport system permease protein
MAYSSSVPVAGEAVDLDTFGSSADDFVSGGAAKAPRTRLLGALPFAVYTLLFLGVPTFALVIGAFQAHDGSFTWDNLHTAVTGVYRHGLWMSIKLSLITSIAPAAVGLVLAYAVHTAPHGTLLRRLVTTAAGVFANFGGVPLAFLFIATLGTGGAGLATNWLGDIGIHLGDLGFDLFAFSGVTTVYFYFQVPLMVLVITPALEGLKPAWREAADNLGASSWSYWRFVGGPVLLPSFLGAVLLLFGSAFSAYATAQALTSGSIPLTSIQIGTFLNGNVIAGQENVGKALGLVMVVVITILMVLYSLLQKRASKWLR